MKILHRFLLMATLLLGLASASAQQIPVQNQSEGTNPPTATTAPANPPGAFFASIATAAKSLQAKASRGISVGLLDAGRKIASTTTVKWALGVAGSLALVHLFAATLLAMGQDRRMAHIFFEVGVPVVFCGYLLLNYDSLIDTFAGSTGFLSYIRNVGGDPGTGTIEMYSKVLSLVALSIKTACADLTDTFSVFSLSASLLALFDAVMVVLFSIAILGLCLSGVVEMLGLILIGPFLSAVAIAMGPIFIAGLATPWTRPYFEKWVGFLVGSAVLTGALGVCVSIASSLFQFFNFYEVAGTDAPSATALLILAIVIMTVNTLIQQAPAVASALVPGSIGVSKGVGNAIRSGASSVHGRVTGSVRQAREMLRGVEKNKSTPATKAAWTD